MNMNLSPPRKTLEVLPRNPRKAVVNVTILCFPH
jgi:hypothetical protein